AIPFSVSDAFSVADYDSDADTYSFADADARGLAHASRLAVAHPAAQLQLQIPDERNKKDKRPGAETNAVMADDA
ncbi:MAG: hypothetical protein M3379_21605, partial [Acidobacteriota bacterium]|nr:hypothetical protein [Acidobacteriota bacterium]